MLQTPRSVFFLREPKRRRQLRHSRKGLGGPEIVKNDKIPKIHTLKIQGRVFSEGAEAPQAARHSRKGLGGPEIVKNDKIHEIHTPKLRRGVFSEGAEATQAADTNAKGWGNVKPANKCEFQKHAEIPRMQNRNVEIGIGPVSTCPKIKISKKSENISVPVYI